MGNRSRGIGRRVAMAGYWNIFLGMAVAAVGTAVFLGASAVATTAAFWGGATAVLGGTTLTLSGISAVDRPTETGPRLPAWWVHSRTGDTKEVPKLGELAVHHAAFITQEQLEAALEAHKEERRLLGGVMVSMGLVTPEQLAELLTVQELRADHWGRGR